VNSIGNSGYDRVERDFYPTPAENVAALAAGLRRARIELPYPVLDPAGGDGAIARGLTALDPRAVVRLTDIDAFAYPAALPLYLTTEPLDAGDIDDLRRAARASKASAIVMNPPYERWTQARIVAAALGLVREGLVDLVASLHLSNHLTTNGGHATTTMEQFFRVRIDCAWRTRLFDTGDGTGGKQSHSWRVWTGETGRMPGDPFPTISVSLAEASALLSGEPAPKPRPRGSTRPPHSARSTKRRTRE
jgi:hypothetical protein